MVYVKIVIGSLIWGVILWNIAEYAFKENKEQVCISEVRKKNPESSIVKENCLATADTYVTNEDYGTASWYYVLSGELDKNINEIEEKISDDFYINIGHTYVLKNDFKKAKKVYKDFIFAGSGGYTYQSIDEIMREDYSTLNHVYPDKKKNLAKGMEQWRELYAPVGKMVDVYAKYEQAVADDNTTASIAYLKEAIEYAEPYKDEEQVEYAKWVDTLAELYYDEEAYNDAITYYKKAVLLYADDKEKQLSYADSLFWIAKSHYYLEDYAEAINYYKKSLPLYVEAESNASYNIGYVYHNIGNSYSEERNETLQLEAVKYYKKSIEHKKMYNPDEFDSLARSYNNMGDVYYKAKQFNKAKKAHEEAIELEKKMFNEEDEDEIEDTLSELDTLASYHQDLSDTYRELKDVNGSVQIQNDYLSFVEKNYGDYKFTLVEGYDTVANYFRYKNSSLSFEYYQKALNLLDKNNKTELSERKQKLSLSIVEDMLYVCDEVDYDRPLEAIRLVKWLIDYQEEMFQNKLSLAKSYYKLATFSKENVATSQKKSLQYFQDYLTEGGDLEDFSILVKYYDSYVEGYAENDEKDKAIELMDEFMMFIKTHYSDNNDMQFEVYASSSYMYKMLANYKRSIEDIIKANLFKDALFKIDCADLVNVYDASTIYIDPESVPKLQEACETIT